MAVAVRDQQGALQSTDEIVRVVKQNIERAREARKPLEKTWLSNLAFAAGQAHLVWDEPTGGLRHVQQVDPEAANRTLYTANRIREYLDAQMGELSSGDDRPQILTVQEGDEPSAIAKQLNHAVEYAWAHEWNADKALRRARGYALTMGTAAIRSRFDATKGPVAGHLPLAADGQPVTDPAEIQSLQATGALLDGTLPRFQEVKEGRTCWEPFTAFHILAPPGVTHEDDFPWFALCRPVPIDTLIEQYGPVAEGLVEDGDIGSVSGLASGQGIRIGSNEGRVRGHVWLYTYYDLPCRKYPKGRVVVLASNSFRLIDIQDQLDYQAPDGTWRTGVQFFHWHRLDDRFYSQAFIEPLKDPQRAINDLKTTQLELIFRGLAKVFVKEGDLRDTPRGLPLEVVEMNKEAQEPHFFAGIGPGAWMDQMVAACADDLAHASTLSGLKLGENPQAIDTYSQLALLLEQENYKRSGIITDHGLQIAVLVENGVHDIKTWWPPQKQVLVAGQDDGIATTTFQKSQIPPFYQAKVAESATPRSQGAELTKIDAIWHAAEATGVVVGPNAQKWAEWYAASVNAGEAQDIPEEETDSQVAVAHFENTVMRDGEVPPPADHDLNPVHMPIHREALDQARAAGDAATAQRIQQHIDLSTQAATVARKQWRIFDPADLTDMASDLALDEDQALRENEMMIHGQPLNREEVQKAYAQLQHGINPETGQPATAQDDLQGILLRASLKPTLVENLEMHMDRHGKVIKSAEFESFPAEVRQRFLTHFDLTRDLYLSLPTMPEKVMAPKVSLQLRESVGPTTVSQVLRRAGVPEGDPNVLAAEPPMETLVQDSVDQADVDGGSPGQTGGSGSPAPKQ